MLKNILRGKDVEEHIESVLEGSLCSGERKSCIVYLLVSIPQWACNQF
jgi:hypothetical protein